MNVQSPDMGLGLLAGAADLCGASLAGGWVETNAVGEDLEARDEGEQA